MPALALVSYTVATTWPWGHYGGAEKQGENKAAVIYPSHLNQHQPTLFVKGR